MNNASWAFFTRAEGIGVGVGVGVGVAVGVGVLVVVGVKVVVEGGLKIGLSDDWVHAIPTRATRMGRSRINPPKRSLFSPPDRSAESKNRLMRSTITQGRLAVNVSLSALMCFLFDFSTVS